MTTQTEPIALAAHTPIGTRYALVAVPGTELTDGRCPACGGAHAITKCPEIAAEGDAPLIEGLRREVARLRAELDQAFEAGRNASLADYIALDQINTDLRLDLDQAHQHIGALIGMLPPTSINPSRNAALSAARAWLRREAGR